MNLKSLSDDQLLADTKMHARNEKVSGIAVLHHIREVDARKLFVKAGCNTLYAYCLQELELSETTAGRRIQAMKLIRDLPEYETKLKEAAVFESTLSTVQTFLNREKKKRKKTYTKAEKLKLLKDLEGVSARNTERMLATISPTSARKESTKAINKDETEISFTIRKELADKLKKIQDLLGHKLVDQQYVTLLEEIADIALKKLEPKPPTSEVLESSTRYIPANVKRQVWERDQGRCTYKTREGLCNSKFGLQFEHVLPFAKGGKSSTENLTLHCLAHNQVSAIRQYGLKRMQEFLKC